MTGDKRWWSNFILHKHDIKICTCTVLVEQCALCELWLHSLCTASESSVFFRFCFSLRKLATTLKANDKNLIIKAKAKDTEFVIEDMSRPRICWPRTTTMLISCTVHLATVNDISRLSSAEQRNQLHCRTNGIVDSRLTAHQSTDKQQNKLETRSPAVARRAAHTACQHTMVLGGDWNHILAEQVSVGSQRWYRWIGRW